MDWLKGITFNDIPPGKMSDIAIKNGLSDVISLMKNVGGLQLYIPIYGKKRLNIDYIKETYSGKNTLSIAIKLGINVSKVLYFFKKKDTFQKPAHSNNYMKIVVNKCGKDIALRLIENFSGEKIYIPRNGFSIIRRKKIIEEFNGNNTLKLSLKYMVSERYVSKIIADSYKNKNIIQLNLFKNNL